MEDQVPALLRDQLSDIIAGAVFLFIGVASCSIAVIRGESKMRLFMWLGIWSGMYGLALLAGSRAVLLALPHWIVIIVPHMITAITYVGVVVALLAFRELSLGLFRLVLEILSFAASLVAVAGITYYIFGGKAYVFVPYTRAIAICGLVALVTVIAVKKLSTQFMVLFNRRVLGFGMLVFALSALWSNLSRPPHYQIPRLLGNLGFAAFLLSFGYVAVQMTLVKERRLLSIENELKVARDLQLSILPSSVPEVCNLQIAAAYRPMASVAGDYYDFTPVDGKRAGILVADVAGHGVPAALIASMIKVAKQSISDCAHDPGEVLRRLNRTLSPQLPNQLISAAYLWLDTEKGKASYSAAGHPPLLRWRKSSLERIESNGLLFGVMTDTDYPVCDMEILSGDLFLLCTDGVTEPENRLGDAFGDRKLEEVVRENRSCSPAGLSEQLLREIALWQSASQQDDITLIIVDVL